MMPGAMPAINSLLMESPLETPKIMSGMEGGIMGRNNPAGTDKPGGAVYRIVGLRIIGTSSAATAAVSATAEPDRLAMIIAASTPT